jgi:hypothetical protein
VCLLGVHPGSGGCGGLGGLPPIPPITALAEWASRPAEAGGHPARMKAGHHPGERRFTGSGATLWSAFLSAPESLL